jgi:hypothetical protein
MAGRWSVRKSSWSVSQRRDTGQAPIKTTTVAVFPLALRRLVRAVNGLKRWLSRRKGNPAGSPIARAHGAANTGAQGTLL